MNWHPSSQNRYSMRQEVNLSNSNTAQQDQLKMMNFDEFLEFEKRIVTVTQVLENFNVNTWTSQFKFGRITTNDLQSFFIDQNENFQQLKSMIDLFNEEVRHCEYNKKPLRNGPWRNAFYQSLLNMLFEVLQTKNREIQVKFIDKILKWALEIVTKMDYQGKKNDADKKPPLGGMRPVSSVKRPPSSDKRPMSGISKVRPASGYPMTSVAGETMAETTIDFSVNFHGMRPDSAGEDSSYRMREPYGSQRDLAMSQLPSDNIKEQLRDYNNGSRTRHDDCEPPQIRLKNFKRRMISNLDQRSHSAQPIVVQQSTFTKPQKAIVNQGQMEQPLAESEINNQQVLEDAEIIEQLRQEELKKNIGILNPDVKVFLDDVQLSKPINRELNDQFEQRSTFIQYQPTNDVREMNLDQHYVNRRNREVAHKREDQEMINMMNEWSQVKGRVEKEMNRRIESATYGNKFREVDMKERANKEEELHEINKIYDRHKRQLNKTGDVNELLELSDLSDQDLLDEEIEIDDEEDGDEEQEDFLGDEEQRPKKTIRRPVSSVQKNFVIDIQNRIPQPPLQAKFMNNTDFHDLEANISKKRIDDVKKLHGKLINIQNATQEQAPTQQGSLSVYDQGFKKQVRPFSAVLEKCPLDRMRQEQMKEICEIKTRLAKNNVNVPVSKLISAMLIPDPFNLQDPQGLKLPQPGFGLMKNPFEKKKKKKRSSKKKQKK